MFLCTDLVPWQELAPVFGFMQFTWRLLLISTSLLSFSSGIIIYEYLKNSELKYISHLLVILYIIFICLINQKLSYLSIETYYAGSIEKLYDYNSFTVAAGEYLPVKLDIDLIRSDIRECKTNSQDIKIEYEQISGKSYIVFENNLSEDTYIDIPLLYYKGYVAKSDKSHKYDLSEGYNTWIRINIGNVKEDNILLTYEGTNVLKVSYIISLISIIGFSILKYKDKII